MSDAELRVMAVNIAVPAIALLGALVYVARFAWLRLRGQVVGEVETHAQGDYFQRPGRRRILVKRNVARGQSSSVDIVFRGTDRIATVDATVVPQVAQAIERAAQMASGDARGPGWVTFGSFPEFNVRAEPDGTGRRRVCLSFLQPQAEGPDLLAQYLLTSAHAAALAHLLRVAATRTEAR